MLRLSVIPWDFVAILLVLGVLVPWRGAVRVRDLLARPALNSRERIAIYASTIFFQWVLAALTAWRCFAHGWDLTSLGIVLPHPWKTIGAGLALGLLLSLTQLFAFRQLGRIPLEQRGRLGAIAVKLMPRNRLEALPFVALVCTVSICEEFLYRGFVFSLAQRFFSGSSIAALVTSSAVFGFGHYYQGRRGVVNTSILGALFASMRIWTGSLAPAMLGHFAVDIVAGRGGSRWALAQSEAQDAASGLAKEAPASDS